jgi:hypothetical protein
MGLDSAAMLNVVLLSDMAQIKNTQKVVLNYFLIKL